MCKKLLTKGGIKKKEVRKWQNFLVDEGLYHGPVNGIFNEETKEASRSFRELRKLDQTRRLNKKITDAGIIKALWCDDWPPEPSFGPLSNVEDLQEVFGKFNYIATPTEKNPEHITVLGNWVEENIVDIYLPQLEIFNGKPPKVKFHIKAKNQFIGLWNKWEAEGLSHLIKTWDGSYDPRFRRGKAEEGILSCHAFGSAFDINYKWNKFTECPASVGETGSVRELVEIANDFGFYWGGHFPAENMDGMHFEVAVIKDKPWKIKRIPLRILEKNWLKKLFKKNEITTS